MKKSLFVVVVPLMFVATITRGGSIDPCMSSASSAGGVLLVCPSGDGPTLAAIGATISVIVEDAAENPIPGIPPEDFWVDGLPFITRTCGVTVSSSADGPTDASGHTTMSGSIAAGGYCNGVYAIAQGTPVGPSVEYEICDTPLPLTIVSPDINNDRVVDSGDLALFAVAYAGGDSTLDPRMDFNGDGTIDSLDFTMFGNHYLHQCSE
jgi:hypothetical protein